MDLIRLVGSLIRTTDIFARWGGEELIILTTDLGLQGNGTLAERIRGEIERHPFPVVGSMRSSRARSAQPSGHPFTAPAVIPLMM